MACNILNAYKNEESCKITMAGTGDRVYFFDKDAWATRIKNAAAIIKKGLPVPGYKGFYGVDEEGTKDDQQLAKLALLNGFLFAIDIKTDSGQVTSEKAAENEASSQVGTFMVVDNVKNWNELAHTLAFKNFGCIIPRVGGGYYMVMSPYKKSTLESNYDSGTTYDSDHGFTATVNASPAEYGVTFLPDGSVHSDGVSMSIVKKEDTGCTVSFSGATVTVPDPALVASTTNLTLSLAGDAAGKTVTITNIPTGKTITATPTGANATTSVAGGVVTITPAAKGAETVTVSADGASDVVINVTIVD